MIDPVAPMSDTDSLGDGPPGPRQLTRHQRRVLGVLVEKAITTPEQYPLTLKALTAGCNQKSNRDPVTNYNEESVEQYLDELRALGLVACVHTESGRTERFRHYVRKRYPFTEPQLAIITELWLRGRQQPGELRTRASRMAPIDSQEQLRTELSALMEQGFVQADGPLDRRGVLVDHAFYHPEEAHRLQPRTAAATMDADAEDRFPGVSASPARIGDDVASEWQSVVRRLEAAQSQFADELHEVRGELERLQQEVAELRRSLGA